jgi:hypothetical protein
MIGQIKPSYLIKDDSELSERPLGNPVADCFWLLAALPEEFVFRVNLEF